jgi:acyl-CoA synthetase (AMP-forming)/AMP-acid ligase II
LPTGGTTGASKGVLQTHFAFETYVSLHMLTMYSESPPKYLAAAPMVHAAGGMCFPMLARGGTIYVQDGAKPLEVARSINRYGITDVFLPPTVIYMMLADPEIRGMRFPTLKYLLYGAAPMSTSKLREALDWLGPVLVQGYGQTEAIMLCTVMQPSDHYVAGDLEGEIVDDERLSSCGRPAPLVKLAIMADDGRLLPDGATGEIVVRANHVMKGYYEDPAATEAASMHGWHHTGDVGYRDADGYYHVVDRLRDMIISGGLNIYPSEIEQVVWAHPAVKDCAVVGAPDEKWGEVVTAVVELKPGASADPDEIVAFCRDRLGSVKGPKTVLVWSEMPRSPVGKVLKRDIRDRLWAGVHRRV